MKKHLSRARIVLFEYSGLLVIGAMLGLVLANLDPQGYHAMLEWSPFAGQHDDGHPKMTFHHFINEVLMASFFGLATKEVWEALLPPRAHAGGTIPGGPLSGLRQAAMPLFATVGGMLGPALLFVVGVHLWDAPRLMSGWAIPCATDIAFSYLAARLVFGDKHPAIPFLLLLAIADDGGGLAILAIFYPSSELNLVWFATLVILAMVIAWGLHKNRVHSWLPYVFGAGSLSWLGFYVGGIEPALGLVPIIPFIPHAKTDLGLFMKAELHRHDTLSEMEHALKPVVQGILFLFGLVNAGVSFSNVGVPTVLISGALLLGKPLGIVIMVLVGKMVGLCLPEGMNLRHVVVLGVAAGIGFTVALFVTTVAFQPGVNGITVADVDAAKMGALGSFGAFGLTWATAKLLRIKRV